MSPDPRSSAPAGADWRPTASLRAARKRAEVVAEIRHFFARRGVLEVDTPVLCQATVTDPHLHSLAVEVQIPGMDPGSRRFYLQTSPEFSMKRLLAAGYGAIYQIGKAFRNDESGRHHNPEFTMLEWYRPAFDHHRLMDEMDALLGAVLGARPANRLTYGDAFRHHAGADPLGASIDELADIAVRSGIEIAGFEGSEMLLEAARDDWLHLLWSHQVEPHLGRREPGTDTPRPTFVYDYPPTQAALARIRPATDDVPAAAERFEVYLEGLELANGFHELADPREQRRRFDADLDERRRRGLPVTRPDPRLLAALEHGLPACAGVALGIDRLVMLAFGAETLDQVLTFPIARS